MNMHIVGISKILIVETTDSVKDAAADVGVSDGDTGVFIDMDVIKHRILALRENAEKKELMEVMTKAFQAGVGYVHML